MLQHPLNFFIYCSLLLLYRHPTLSQLTFASQSIRQDKETWDRFNIVCLKNSNLSFKLFLSIWNFVLQSAMLLILFQLLCALVLVKMTLKIEHLSIWQFSSPSNLRKWGLEYQFFPFQKVVTFSSPLTIPFSNSHLNIRISYISFSQKVDFTRTIYT